MHLPRTAIVVMVSAAACKSTVDTKGLEKTIADRITQMGLTADRVSCPGGVEAKAGAKFTCQITIEHTAFDLNVTVIDVDSSTNQVNMDTQWAKGSGVVRTKVVDLLSRELSSTLDTKITVDCGKDALLFLIGNNLRCKVIADQQSAAVIITLDDKLVPTKWELDPPLLVRKKLESLLTPSVRDQTKLADVTVNCGDQLVLPRPADGNLTCHMVHGGQRRAIRVAVSPALDIERWDAIDE